MADLDDSCPGLPEYLDSSNSKQNNLKLSAELFQQKQIITVSTLSDLGENYKKIYKEVCWFLNHEKILHVEDLCDPDEDLIAFNKYLVRFLWWASKAEAEKLVEAEYEKIKQRKKVGRKPIELPDNWDELYVLWKSKKINSTQFRNKTGLKKATFYNVLKRYENEKSENGNSNL